MDTYVDRVLAQRRELKYLTDEQTIEGVRRFIQTFMAPDEFTVGLEGSGYPLASLYLDAPDLRLCYQTLEAQKNRFKLRIRRYSDTPDDPAFFEIKHRVDQVLVKRRARVDYSCVADLLSGAVPRASQTSNVDSLNEFLNLACQANAGPTVLVRYWREAYESLGDEPLRITFDRGLSFCLSRDKAVWLGGPGWTFVPLEGVILEVKYTASYPAWVERMIRQFNLQRRSIPKYVLSLHHAGLCDDRFRVDAGRF